MNNIRESFFKLGKMTFIFYLIVIAFIVSPTKRRRCCVVALLVSDLLLLKGCIFILGLQKGKASYIQVKLNFEYGDHPQNFD